MEESEAVLEARMGYWMECGGRVHVGIGSTGVVTNIRVGSNRLRRRMDEVMGDGARIIRIELAASSVVHLRRMPVVNCFGMLIVESYIVSMILALCSFGELIRKDNYGFELSQKHDFFPILDF